MTPTPSEYVVKRGAVAGYRRARASPAIGIAAGPASVQLTEPVVVARSSIVPFGWVPILIWADIDGTASCRLAMPDAGREGFKLWVEDDEFTEYMYNTFVRRSWVLRSLREKADKKEDLDAW
jgi:hypothetical protein